MVTVIRHSTRLALVSLAVAWGFDQLFWRHSMGISFFIFVLLCLLGGALITWWEGLRPAWRSLILLAPALFFAAMTFIREEPFTLGLSFLLALASLGVLALTWLGGQWPWYSLSDYVMGFLRLASSALARPAMLYVFNPEKKAPPAANPAPVGEEAPASAQPAGNQSSARQWVAVLRGVLLALPVLAVLAALLASADPIFSDDLRAFLSLFRIQNLGIYIFRGIYIFVGAYLLAGLYLHAIGPSREERLIGRDQPWLRPFLGWIEAIIVLGAVDLLFAFFVAIQARYFFGGQANITAAGYTYAEYARRGFNELVAVAVISLLLFLALSSAARRETRAQRRLFTALGVALVVLVGVILVSAYQRLLLYEAAYGFTRIRTYTHVLMVWVGVLLAITVGLDLANRLRGFALGLALVAIGFGVTLSLLNVDGFIARENIARAQNGSALDTAYLISLSNDAAPALVQGFQNPALSASLHARLGATLACRSYLAGHNRRDTTWPSFTVSRATATALYARIAPELSAYPVSQVNGVLQVTVNGAIQSCLGNGIGVQ